ncbi:hypothetical protein HID58_002323, partial [Brassica napus]
LEDGQQLGDLDSSEETTYMRRRSCWDLQKSVRIHDPVKIMVPCAVFEVESPIPPDKGVYLSSYIEVLDDQHH